MPLETEGIMYIIARNIGFWILYVRLEGSNWEANSKNLTPLLSQEPYFVENMGSTLLKG